MLPRQEALIDAVKRVMPALAPTPRITGAHFVRNDVALTGGNAGNQRGRVILLPELIVLIEGSDAAAVKAAGGRLLSDQLLLEWGAKPGEVRGMYQMEYSIQNLAG